MVPSRMVESRLTRRRSHKIRAKQTRERVAPAPTPRGQPGHDASHPRAGRGQRGPDPPPERQPVFTVVTGTGRWRREAGLLSSLSLRRGDSDPPSTATYDPLPVPPTSGSDCSRHQAGAVLRCHTRRTFLNKETRRSAVSIQCRSSSLCHAGWPERREVGRAAFLLSFVAGVGTSRPRVSTNLLSRKAVRS